MASDKERCYFDATFSLAHAIFLVKDQKKRFLREKAWMGERENIYA